jgi:PAS domain S-box-containing protein
MEQPLPPNEALIEELQRLRARVQELEQNETGLRLIEHALRESEERFRQFVEHLPFVVWMTLPDRRRPVFVNSAYEAIFGRLRSALLTDPLDWLQAIHPEDRHLLGGVRDLSDVSHPFQDEFRIRRPDGCERWLHNRAIPLRNREGEVYLYAGITEDVTERRLAEGKIRELNAVLESQVEQRTAALEASLRELESFSYSVSHDLRAPLRGINGFSQLLLEDYGSQLDEEGQGHLKRICAATQRMGDLIDDLLTLARISRTQLNARRVNLSVLAQEIGAELRQIEPDRDVELAIAPDVTVAGDMTLLRILLENLLGNAWKFTKRNPHARIEFGIARQRGRRAFFVRDNGVGFDKTYAHKLFEPFERLHGVEEFPGSGVGLATVKRIVTRHGGRVWADGTPDAGATFYFTLG